MKNDSSARALETVEVGVIISAHVADRVVFSRGVRTIAIEKYTTIATVYSNVVELSAGIGYVISAANSSTTGDRGPDAKPYRVQHSNIKVEFPG